MPNPVTHFEIMGKDAAATQQFYAQLFDWPVNAKNPMTYGVVEAQGNGIGGGLGANPQKAIYVTVYVEVADLGPASTRPRRWGARRSWRLRRSRAWSPWPCSPTSTATSSASSRTDRTGEPADKLRRRCRIGAWAFVDRVRDPHHAGPL